MEKLKLPVHEHPLYRGGANDVHGNRGMLFLCDGCLREGHIDDGFRCSQCPIFYLHRKCGESVPKINHPSHFQHPLKLLTGARRCSDKSCHLCGVDLELLCYHCSICDFTLDTSCAINPPPLSIIKQPKAHEHPLTLMDSTDTDFTCHICCEDRKDNKFFYECNLCDFFFHIECVSLSPEINHPCHPRHHLKFLSGGTDPSGSCTLCGEDVKHGNCYRCSICDFTLGLKCVKNPPPLALASAKTHKHQLSLMPMLILFTCNACGMPGDRTPYVCGQCNLMIHLGCVDLPGVICINRHDHPISHTYDLDLLGNSVLECGVCRQTMNSSYGAYCCLKCKNYAVHSRCATLNSGWDGRDIEGEPEEIEDVSPFKVVGNNLIKHFSHEEHDMELIIKDGSHVLGGAKSCKACIKFISDAESFYKCIQCEYVLHETCANFPRKIRTVLSAEKPILVGGASYFRDTFHCATCKRYSSGFKYISGSYEIDLQCIAITEPLKREAHHHPLYYFVGDSKNCSSCGEEKHYGFQCLKVGCEFNLHYECAISPETVKHKSDDHTLRLCYRREDEYDQKYWCDICEKQLDHSKSKQYYACDDCGTTLHIKCVLGDLLGSITPGSIVKHREFTYDGFMIWQYRFEVASNTGINRPLCCICHSRCTFSLVLKSHDNHNRYVCSYDCLPKFRPPNNVFPRLRNTRR